MFLIFGLYTVFYEKDAKISYSWPKVTKQILINISIYDLMGRNIKTLVNGFQKSGLKSVVWDATNDEGHEVAAGLYFYKMEAGNFRRTNKMLLLK